MTDVSSFCRPGSLAGQLGLSRAQGMLSFYWIPPAGDSRPLVSPLAVRDTLALTYLLGRDACPSLSLPPAREAG